MRSGLLATRMPGVAIKPVTCEASDLDGTATLSSKGNVSAEWARVP